MRGKLKCLVKDILTLYPQARNSDMYLTFRVWESENPTILDYRCGFSIKNFTMFGVSSFESISRCRRKLQSEFPELRADLEVQQARQEKELDYLAIARSN